MKKRFLSILLSLCMVLTLVPATVFAADATVGENEAYVEEPEQTAVEQVQALINALPDADAITEENRADVEAQLTAIDEAKLPLGDDDKDTLDFKKYNDAIAALNVLDGICGAEVPDVMATAAGILDVGNYTFEGVTETTKLTLPDGGTATFDPATSTLTLENAIIKRSAANAQAIRSEISGLKIVLKGQNKIIISNNNMVGMYFEYGAEISGSGNNSKLIIESTGKNNKGIYSLAALKISSTSITIDDKTTSDDDKGCMVGIWTTSGSLSMNNVNYTATRVLCAIELGGKLNDGTLLTANCTLNNVTFNVNCTPPKNFDIEYPETSAVGVHTSSGKNTITRCSGSITAQFPLYIDSATELKDCNNLTLTTDNYSAANLNDDLTISGGNLSFKSNGSASYGFNLKDSSKLVFENNTNVTVDVVVAGIIANGNNSSVEIKGGTVNTTAKVGLSLNNANSSFTLSGGKLDMKSKSGEDSIGIQSSGTITVTGGSLITTGMWHAISNLGNKPISISGGTHTLGSVSGDNVGYVDTNSSVLNISNNANVTFTGGKNNISLRGRLNLSGGTLNTGGATVAGIFMNSNSTANLTGGTLSIDNTQYGISLNGCRKLIFAGTNAKLNGTTSGLHVANEPAGYTVTSGTVVFQGGASAAPCIYSSSLPEGYSVFAGSAESNATIVSNPSDATFTGNKYVCIRPILNYTLTLESVYLNDYGLDVPDGSSPATYTHNEGSDISYTAADALAGFHFDHWKLNGTKVSTNKTYTGTMPSGNATLSAVYVTCSGGTATCTEKAKCSSCGKDYGVLKPHDYSAQEETTEACVSKPTCILTGEYYYSCSMCHEVEGDKYHTFYGTKLDLNNHVGCTSLALFLTSYGGRDEMTIQLIKSGETEPTATKTTQNGGNDTNWNFYHLDKYTTYTLRVMKNNHVTREYTVTFENVSKQLNAEICLIGDVNGDGNVNTKDWAMMYDHINETNALSDYPFACGDVNGDGKVNTKDWNMMYDHINETKPLW